VENEQKTRSHETVVEINAPPDVVWKAIAEADGITRWFAPFARVEPGVGGTIWLSWGEGMDGSSRIEIWEPGKHLRVGQTYKTPLDPETPPPTPIAVEYFLEGKGGSTVLRLVHSGFGTHESWDDEYECTKRGWAVFLRTLKQALEVHAGKSAHNILAMAATSMNLVDAWAWLTGPACLAAEGKIDGLKPGEAYRIRTALGQDLSGKVEINAPPRDNKAGYGEFVGTVKELDDAVLWPTAGSTKEGVNVTINLISFGLSEERAGEIQSQLNQLLEKAASA
jgi:uncharacterized protein YndB with AHSA1/START domain